MPSVPFPITGQDAEAIKTQVNRVIRDLYEERIGGYEIGNGLYGDSDFLSVNPSSTGGLETSGSEISIKNKSDGGLTSGTSGEQIKIKATGGLDTDSEGLFIKSSSVKGFREGMVVTIKDEDELYVSGGAIDICGAVYDVTTQQTVSLGTLAANTLYYLYVDAPASGIELAAADFTVSSTAPTWSDTYGAYYKTGDATKRLVAKYYQAGGSSSLSPAVDSDDGRWGDSLFGPASVNASFGIGATYKSFFRFPDFPANNGDTISSAILTMTSRGTGSSAALDALCCFNDVDDATAPTTYAGAEALVLTAGTAWSSVPDVAQYSNYTTPDCASDLQNVINRAGYALGNAIMMVIKGVSGTGWRMVYDIYDDPTYKASLAIVINASGTTQAINPIKTICDIGRDDGNELNDNDLLVYDSTLGSLKGHASSTAGYVLEADTDGLPSTSSLKATGEEVTITGAGQANTVTLNESLTVGDGYSGTLTFSAASKTITVEDTSTVNQDLTTDASPTFVTAKLTGLTDGKIPYHVADATGLADGPTKTDVDDAVSKKHSQNTDTGTTGATFTVNSGAGTTLVITGGANTFSIADGTASLDIAAAATLNIDKSLTVDGQATTITGAGQANTLTLNESLTVGDGYSGTLTFSADSKTLTVENTSVVNQDLTTDANPQFATIELGHATDTTLARVSAGVVSIEGKNIYVAGGTDVAVADGGTGLSSGTSGGILGYTAAGTIASSVALTDSVLVVGGGAGATPTPLADGLGATTEYLRGNAAGEPTWETLNQAAVAGLTTASSPTFVTTKLSGLSADVFPYNTLTPDLLDEDCSDISDWTDADFDTGVSEVDPAGQFRFDTNLGAAGNARAVRTRTISSPPDTFTIEIKTYFDSLGTFGASDYFSLWYGTATWRMSAIFASDGLRFYKAAAATTEVGTDIVKCNASAAWQTWRFEVDKTAGEAAATVEVFLDGVSQGTYDCDYEVATTNGGVLLGQWGYGTDNMVSHVDYIKIATGLGEISGGLVDSIVSKYGKSVLINGGLNVGGSTDPGDNNLLVIGTLHTDGAATLASCICEGNLTIGGATVETGSTNNLSIANGTAPDAHVDNQIIVYSADTSDATATLALFLEQAVEDIGTFTASHKIKVLINGTAYWIQLDAV